MAGSGLRFAFTLTWLWGFGENNPQSSQDPPEATIFKQTNKKTQCSTCSGQSTAESCKVV